MTWNDIWKIVLCAVGSAGGIGLIIVGAVKFASNIIADRLSQKYASKLQIELEQHRATLDGKIHMTKAQYDAEFNVYRTLSKTYFRAILTLHTAFMPEYRSDSTFSPEKIDKIKEEFMKMAKDLQSAQDTLYENAAFISKSLYNSYELIIDEANDLFWEYKEKVFSDNIRDVIEDIEWLDKKYQSVEKLETKLAELNDELRIYLQCLTIVE